MWIINTHNGIKGKLPRIDVNEYPAIKAHLDQYWDKISKRADKGDTPYNLRNCAYMEDFMRPKIIWKRIGSILRFSYDTSGHFGLDSTCFSTGQHMAYLCCILNSFMGHYMFKDSPKTGTGDLLVSVQAIEPISVPMNRDAEFLFEKLLNQVLEHDSKEAEKEINRIVFQLYDLSPTEISYIIDYVTQSQQSQ